MTRSSPPELPPSDAIVLSWADEAHAARLRVDRAPYGRCEVVAWEAPEHRSSGVPHSPGRAERVEGMPQTSPMAGTFERAGDALLFTPRFLFTEGVRYALLVDGAPVASLLRPVTPPPAPAVVTGIFPTGVTVPVNLLRMHVQFSSPMSEGFAARSVTITAAGTGEPLAYARLDTALDTPPELWDAAHTRLTVLLEPARITRGVVPLLEAGCSLVEGRPIVVSVDAAFRDAAGAPLAEGFSRRYDVVSALSDRVDPAQWTMRAPAAGSVQALQIGFDRPLDRALLAQCLSVRDANGGVVAGDIHIPVGERSWSFRPATPWEASSGYALAIDTQLQDVSGNSLMHVFDRDGSREEDNPAGDHRVELLPIHCR